MLKTLVELPYQSMKDVIVGKGTGELRQIRDDWEVRSKKDRKYFLPFLRVCSELERRRILK